MIKKWYWIPKKCAEEKSFSGGEVRSAEPRALEKKQGQQEKLRHFRFSEKREVSLGFSGPGP